jgi:SNF2 family DNA or RNA helicase
LKTTIAPLPPLYQWQAKEIAEHGMDRKRALFVSPRLGKTRCVAEQIPAWNVDRTLVVAPLVVGPVWADALRSQGLGVVDAFSGSAKARVDRINNVRSGVVVTNYDFLRTGVDDLIAWGPQATIGDESHILGSPASKRAKAFRRLAWRSEYVRLLTGTPTPNHYGNLWGQLVALDKKEWGPSYERFAQRYLVRDTMFPSRVLGHVNTQELQARVLRFASIVRREDVFGPDEWQPITRHIELPPEARRLYKQLAEKWILNDVGVTADHILKRITRLQQLSAGYVPTDEGELVEVHDAKVEAVLADLDEIVLSGEKSVLFYRFKWEGDEYTRRISERFPDTLVIRINGSVPVERRRASIEHFESHNGPAVAIVQVQAGGVGISFAEATHALFTSRGFSFTDDEQARDRIFKPGHSRCVTYYECDGTVDAYIAGILKSKGNIHEAVVNADREALAYGYIRRTL